jgi:hypothetical protein
MPHTTDLDALRQTILEASLEDANQPKYGYFGFAPPLAIGDTSLAPQAKRKAEEVETVRSFVIGPPKKGATDDVLFQAMPPLALGDPYVDPWKRMKPAKVKYFDPDARFKPAGSVNHGLNKLGYEYVAQGDGGKDPKAIYQKYKDNEFSVLHPPNIKCQPTKKGGGGVLTLGVLMNPFPEHVPDEYDRARAIKKEEMKKHHELLQELPFKSMAYGGRPFASNIESYFCDIPLGMVPRKPKKMNLNEYPHEVPFKPANPSKKGYKGLMGWPQARGEPPNPFPDWIPDPAPQAKRQQKEEGGDERPAFKPPNPGCYPGGGDNPQKSVMMHPRNLRSMYPASFVRPKI